MNDTERDLLLEVVETIKNMFPTCGVSPNTQAHFDKLDKLVVAIRGYHTPPTTEKGCPVDHNNTLKTTRVVQGNGISYEKCDYCGIIINITKQPIPFTQSDEERLVEILHKGFFPLKVTKNDACLVASFEGDMKELAQAILKEFKRKDRV